MKQETSPWPALKVDKLVKYYEGKSLLTELSFTLGTEEIVCLLGPSGSGKSTLLRIIAGLESFEHGTISWQGSDLAKISTEMRSFGLMFQDYALFPHLNVFDNVAFGLRMQRLPEIIVRQKANHALEIVGMPGFSKRKIQKLSGGEQQRIALARTLAPEPKMIMLDEPLGALDRKLREQLIQEIRRILKSAGVPAIYVTHDQEEAFSLADRILILSNGRISQIGSPEDLYQFPASSWVAKFLGLGTIIDGVVQSNKPYTVRTILGDIRCSSSGRSWKVGTNLKVLIRPDSVELKHPGKNTCLGVVEDCIFQGEHYRTMICVNGEPIIFNLPERHRMGDQIMFSIKEEGLIFFESNHDRHNISGLTES